jgi:hypothetical protein
MSSRKLPTAWGKAPSETEGGYTKGEAPERDEPCTWLRDGTSPRSRMAEQTVERLRKPVDGTKRGIGYALHLVDANR